MVDPARTRWNPLAPRGPAEEITSTSAEGNVRYFLKWFPRNQYALMESFLHQLDHRPTQSDRGILRERFLRATRHARKVLALRLAVTVLLVLATGSAIATALLRSLDAVPGAREAVERVATLATSLTVVLVVLRFALDRYLARVTVYTTFIGMQIAGERHAYAPENDEDAYAA